MEMSVYRKIIAGRDKLLENLDSGKSKWDECACINIIYPDIDDHISTNQACHAGLNNYNPGSVAVVSALMKPKKDKILGEDEALLFLDWLLNRSPYSCTFITKSAHEALFYKATISSSDHPSNLMAAGMVASRRLWEYPEVARVFCDLVKAGVNEDLAFYLAHLYSGTFDRGGKVGYDGLYAGHCSIDPRVMGEKELLNWLMHRPVKLNEPYKNSTKYSGYDSMFGHNYQRLNVHNNFPYNGEAKAGNANPFPKAGELVRKGCSYDNLIKATAEFQHVLFKQIGFNGGV